MNTGILVAKTDDFVSRGAPLIMAIQPCVDNQDGALPFQYTIGMHDLGYPELIITGLPMEEGHAIFMNLLGDFKKRGVAHCLGFNFNLLDTQITKVVRIENNAQLRDDFMTMTDAYHKVKGRHFKEIEVVQVLWPDQNNKCPGEVSVFLEQIKFIEKKGWGLVNEDGFC